MGRWYTWWPSTCMVACFCGFNTWGTIFFGLCWLIYVRCGSWRLGWLSVFWDSSPAKVAGIGCHGVWTILSLRWFGKCISFQNFQILLFGVSSIFNFRGCTCFSVISDGISALRCYRISWDVDPNRQSLRVGRSRASSWSMALVHRTAGAKGFIQWAEKLVFIAVVFV